MVLCRTTRSERSRSEGAYNLHGNSRGKEEEKEAIVPRKSQGFDLHNWEAARYRFHCSDLQQVLNGTLLGISFRSGTSALYANIHPSLPVLTMTRGTAWCKAPPSALHCPQNDQPDTHVDSAPVIDGVRAQQGLVAVQLHHKLVVCGIEFQFHA